MEVISYSAKVCGRVIRGLLRTFEDLHGHSDSKKSARVSRTFEDTFSPRARLTQTLFGIVGKCTGDFVRSLYTNYIPNNCDYYLM